MRPLIIGSRASRLAVWQAEWIRRRIEAAGGAVRIETIRTSGDVILDRPLTTFAGQGVFVKEIEEALLERRIDLAVHSLKDLPTAQPEGLLVACVPEREDPRDMLIGPGGGGIAGLRRGAVVGTGSPRRACQLRALRPDLRLRDLRGNVDTRLEKLRRGDYEAILMAHAAVLRLEMRLEGTVLEVDEMIPAVGQGALAVEIRQDDRETADRLRALHHPATAAAVAAERALLRGLGGGCQAPIAAHATLDGATLRLRGLVGGAEGDAVLRDRLAGPVEAPEELGLSLARLLLDRGAGRLIAGTPSPPVAS
jgi:hydroxymethylbilane synthase